MTLSRRDPRAGISLLETMIALAVMALVALIMASGLATTARMFDRSNDAVTDVENAVNRLQIRSWVERAASGPFPGRPFAGFSGTEDHLVIEVWPADDLFWAGAPLILTIDRSDGGKIVAVAEGYRDSKTDEILTLDLSRTGTGPQISYFGSVGLGVAPNWQNSWQAQNGLPLLVKISGTTDEPVFPPLVIRPGKTFAQREISLSSLLPPALPSRP